MDRCLLLAFVGFPGSGKTTLMKYLGSVLKMAGVKVRAAYLKTMFPVTSLLCGTFGVCNVAVHKAAVYIDLFLSTFFYIPLKSLFLAFSCKSIILIEEYLYGALVDYYHAMVVLGLRKNIIRFLSRVVYAVLSKFRVVHVVLSLSVYEARKRQHKRGDPRLEFPTYMWVQFLVFNVVKQISTSVLVDARDNPVSNALKLLNLLKAKYTFDESCRHSAL